MTRSHDLRKRRRRPVVIKVLLGLGLLAALAPGRAEASPTRFRHQHLAGPRSSAYWDAYFTRALEAHSTHVFAPRWMRDLTSVGGLLPQTPFVSYLEWRRSLNPARFDHYHPRLGPMLAEDEQLRATPKTIASQHINPTHQERPPHHAPHLIVPPHRHHPRQETIPEPGTATIALFLIGSASLARRSRRRLGPALLE